MQFKYFSFTLRPDGKRIYSVFTLTTNELVEKANQELNPSQVYSAKNLKSLFIMILEKWNRGNDAGAELQTNNIYLYGPLP